MKESSNQQIERSFYSEYDYQKNRHKFYSEFIFSITKTSLQSNIDHYKQFLSQILFKMPEIPRKPAPPAHLVDKYIAQITQQVEDDVIPVSAGIYSEQSLIQKLKNSSKPILEDYDNKIFFDLAQNSKQKTKSQSSVDSIFKDKTKCSLCPTQSHSVKQEFIVCQFCGRVICPNCIHPRTRLHPMDSNPMGERHRICEQCDTRYLTLQLSHSYVENMTLIEYAIMKITGELEQIQEEVDEFIRKKQVKESKLREGKVRISILKKNNKNCMKEIQEIREQTAIEMEKQSSLNSILQVKTKQKEQQLRRQLQQEMERQISIQNTLQYQQSYQNQEQELEDELQEEIQKQLQSNKQSDSDSQSQSPSSPEQYPEKGVDSFLEKQSNQLNNYFMDQNNNQAIIENDEEFQENQEQQSNYSSSVQQREREEAYIDQNSRNRKQEQSLKDVSAQIFHHAKNQESSLVQPSSILEDSYYNPILNEQEEEKLQNSFVYKNFSNYFTDMTNNTSLMPNPLHEEHGAPQEQNGDSQYLMEELPSEQMMEAQRQQIIKAAFKNPGTKYYDENGEEEERNIVSTGNKCKCIIF